MKAPCFFAAWEIIIINLIPFTQCKRFDGSRLENRYTGHEILSAIVKQEYMISSPFHPRNHDLSAHLSL